jgi:phosphoribosylamine-glycine ligase
LEYNVRFGDPETQTFLPLIKEGFLDLFLDFVNDRDFKSVKLKHEGAAVHVVKASRGYPENPILGDELIIQKKLDRHYYFAGVTSISGTLKTSGGRVCGLTAIGENITEARAICYANLDQVIFPFEHYRKDIAAKALE